MPKKKKKKDQDKCVKCDEEKEMCEPVECEELLDETRG